MTLPALAVQVQGLGNVSADQINTLMSTCNSVADLRAFVGLDGMECWCRGFTAPNDGGQGAFFYDSAATAPDDGGVTTIQPFAAPSAGRWIRQPAGDVAANIPDDSITNAKLVNADAETLLGNLTDLPAPMTYNDSAAVTAFLSYASTALQGAVLLASDAQAIAGTDATRAVTPHALAAAIAAFFAAAFTSSPANPGYFVLPGGIIVQWGTQSPGDDSLETYNFPLAFPTACFVVFGTPICATPKAGGNGGGCIVNILSTTQFQLGIAWNGDNSGIGSANWLAIGH